MCRWVAWAGEPIFLSDVISEPSHSLIHQSMSAHEAKTVTNGDGFGVGWYGAWPEPGVYRELRPAWSDENLLHLARQIRSGLFFAHVRAATGGGTSRNNCHPFTRGRHLFMHNGQVGGFPRLRRRLESMIPDDMYEARAGTTDSEALFLAIVGREEDPVAATAAVLGATMEAMAQAGVKEALRFTAALSDGDNLWAFRFASDERPPTLYWRETPLGTLVVSEPTDDAKDCWHAVPRNHVLIARRDAAPVLQPFSVVPESVAA